MKKGKSYIRKKVKREKLLKAIARGLDQVKLMEEGKLAKKSLRDFVSELRIELQNKTITDGDSV